LSLGILDRIRIKAGKQIRVLLNHRLDIGCQFRLAADLTKFIVPIEVNDDVSPARAKLSNALVDGFFEVLDRPIGTFQV